MGKSSAKICKQQITTELRRWVTKSKQVRINSHIAYGKIKANLSALALMTTKGLNQQKVTNQNKFKQEH